MSKIKLITFDLDDTFWDIKNTIIRAEKNSRKWVEKRIGEEIDWGTFEDFMKIRNTLIKNDSSLEYDLGLLRKKIIAHHTQKYFKNKKNLNIFIDKAFEYFLKERHKITFYDDVLSVLEKLSCKYKLGVLTNGNADINKLKIGHMFDFSISSIDVKSNKPEQNHFLKAQELSKVDFENILHVGDHPINDILGARNLGIEVMWFNLKKIDWVIDENPPIQFTKWSEFIEIFETNHGY
ncbi:MAG: HAD family hydrolase [Gammaproteobacteria bacterium]|nr:HAD family hydrolase [Gammaproteobacteria bacterium]